MDEPSVERDRAITRGLKPKSNAPAALTQPFDHLFAVASDEVLHLSPRLAPVSYGTGIDLRCVLPFSSDVYSGAWNGRRILFC